MRVCVCVCVCISSLTFVKLGVLVKQRGNKSRIYREHQNAYHEEERPDIEVEVLPTPSYNPHYHSYYREAKGNCESEPNSLYKQETCSESAHYLNHWKLTSWNYTRFYMVKKSVAGNKSTIISAMKSAMEYDITGDDDLNEQNYLNDLNNGYKLSR